MSNNQMDQIRKITANLHFTFLRAAYRVGIEEGLHKFVEVLAHLPPRLASTKILREALQRHVDELKEEVTGCAVPDPASDPPTLEIPCCDGENLKLVWHSETWDEKYDRLAKMKKQLTRSGEVTRTKKRG